MKITEKIGSLLLIVASCLFAFGREYSAAMLALVLVELCNIRRAIEVKKLPPTDAKMNHSQKAVS